MDYKQWIQAAPATQENNRESQQLNADKFDKIRLADRNPYASQIISLEHLGIDQLIEEAPDVLTSARREVIMTIRKRIYAHLSTKYRDTNLVSNEHVLCDMLDCYDRACFNNLLRQKLLTVQHRQLNLQWSGTKFDKKGLAGYCDTSDSNAILIAFHPDIAKIAIDSRHGECVMGILCFDALACLMVVFEHEVIHAIINGCLQQANGHGKLFKKMVKTLFGHLEYRHEIGRGNGREKVQLLEMYESKHEQLTVGQTVKIQSDEKTKDNRTGYIGIIMEMKPRVATILNDGEAFIFKVPLQHVFLHNSDDVRCRPVQALYKLFDARKEAVGKGDVVCWIDPDTKHSRSGQIVSTKPLFADIQCSDQLKVQVPYFRLMISTMKTHEPSAMNATIHPANIPNGFDYPSSGSNPSGSNKLDASNTIEDDEKYMMDDPPIGTVSTRDPPIDTVSTRDPPIDTVSPRPTQQNVSISSQISSHDSRSFYRAKRTVLGSTSQHLTNRK